MASREEKIASLMADDARQEKIRLLMADDADQALSHLDR